MNSNGTNAASATLLALIFTALMLPAATRAQVLYGTLLATVVDPSSSSVGGAAVIASNASTGDKRSQITDERGSYAFRNLQPGSYRIRIEKAGFELVEKGSVSVSVNTETRLDLTLAVGSVTQQVQVSAKAPTLQSDRGDVHAENSAIHPGGIPDSLLRRFSVMTFS